MKTIIVDYEAGNLKSVANMLTFLGANFEITSDKNKILNAGKIIFPGQGHFGQAMTNLEKKGLADAIKEAVSKDIPFLGICVGLQILFDRSEEATDTKGLGIIEGSVKKFTKGKIPQIGWNRIKTTENNTFLTDDYFYFVNSYYVAPKNASLISSIADYNGEFCASVQEKNLIAVQFHPEKSSTSGLKFFKKWIESK